MSGSDTFTSARGLRQIRRILEALTEQPMSGVELQEKLHMGRSPVLRYLAHLRAEPKRIRVCEYRQTGGAKTPVFGIGSGEDVARPESDSRKVRAARERKKLRADPDRYAAHLSLRRLKEKIAGTKKAPQTWLSALMPEAGRRAGATATDPITK